MTTRVRVQVPADTLPWDDLPERIANRFGISPRHARRDCRNFQRRLQTPFGLAFHKNPYLSVGENRIAAVICELNGADHVSISRPCTLPYGFPFDVQILIELSPNLRRDNASGGVATMSLKTSLFGRAFQHHRAGSVVIILTTIFTLASISYAILGGLLLYGLAVLYLFMQAPLELADTATRNLHLLIALLSVLVGIAGLTGRAIRNLWSLRSKRATAG